MPSCARHPFARAVAACSRCDDAVCAECHVQARRRIFCLDCALAAAGVRTSGRSGRSAVQYRRRLNGIAPVAVPPAEIDLRDDRSRPASRPAPAAPTVTSRPEASAPPPAPTAPPPAPTARPRVAAAAPAPPPATAAPEPVPPSSPPTTTDPGRADGERRLRLLRRSVPEVTEEEAAADAAATAAWLAEATQTEVTRPPVRRPPTSKGLPTVDGPR